MEKVYTKSIRNVALLGHSGGGKTSLAESMLYISRYTDRLGNTADGNTVCDYDPEEVSRGFSLSLSLANLTWKDTKKNIVFTDAEGHRVRDTNLNKTFQLDISKESLVKQMEENRAKRPQFIRKPKRRSRGR